MYCFVCLQIRCASPRGCEKPSGYEKAKAPEVQVMASLSTFLYPEIPELFKNSYLGNLPDMLDNESNGLYKFWRQTKSGSSTGLQWHTLLKVMPEIVAFYQRSNPDYCIAKAKRGNKACNEKRLLTEDDLTLSRAIEITSSVEAAEFEAISIKDRVASKIHKFTKANAMPENAVCYRCGKGPHKHSDCYFCNAECRKCQKKGHISAACQSKPDSVARKEKRKCKVRQVAETEKSEQEKTDSASAPGLKHPTNEDNWNIFSICGESPIIIVTLTIG
ncbi:hypothetical protein QYM36_006706 [Artemia franciscana]|uniref:CCHC-type domain-containing protein n=1 Tax=Artemia franciscana TaxID=6661 RepID=A0AA88HY59_ARTSF|nr:hypothetical protein QYM36_006706 [Artemia franciscana]